MLQTQINKETPADTHTAGSPRSASPAPPTPAVMNTGGCRGSAPLPALPAGPGGRSPPAAPGCCGRAGGASTGRRIPLSGSVCAPLPPPPPLSLPVTAKYSECPGSAACRPRPAAPLGRGNGHDEG